MRGLLKVVPESGVSYVTARLIGNSGGGYMRTAMVNAGAEQGAARGQAAIAEGGLIGRLTEIGSRAARVLLITDLNSRIPVVIPASRTSAVLAGDNSDRPRLVFASEPKAIRIGDRVVTSGEGGVFPPGLPVGVVAAIDPGGARVEPYAELSQLDYVLLVDYGLAGGLPHPAPAGPGQKRPARRAAARRQEDALSGGARTSPAFRPRRGRTGASRGFCRPRRSLLAAVIALLPLPVPGYAALTPAFALMAVYHWSVYRPDLLPPSGLFAIGFAQDLVTGRRSAGERAGAASRARRRAALPPPLRRPALSVCLGRVRGARGGRRLLGLWALHCVLQLNLFDLRTAIIRGALTVALFPAASLALGRSQRALIGASA